MNSYLPQFIGSFHILHLLFIKRRMSCYCFVFLLQSSSAKLLKVKKFAHITSALVFLTAISGKLLHLCSGYMKYQVMISYPCCLQVLLWLVWMLDWYTIPFPSFLISGFQMIYLPCHQHGRTCLKIQLQFNLIIDCWYVQCITSCEYLTAIAYMHVCTTL